jgi:formate hydrogenlyase subunit 4
MRKLKAAVHSSKATFSYLDLLKLLGKEDLQVTGNPLFSLAPVITFASISVAALFTPMGTRPPLGFAGDLIVLVYFLALASVGVMLGGASTGSPYGALGVAREMMLAMMVEIIVMASLIVGVIHIQSFDLGRLSIWSRQSGPTLSMIIAAAAFFLALQVQLGKLPFDLPEADQEIMGGPFMEASGPKLALYSGAILKQILTTSCSWKYFCQPKTGIIPVDILIHLAKVFIVLILVGLIDAVILASGWTIPSVILQESGSFLSLRSLPYRGLRRLKGYVEQQDQALICFRAGRVTAPFPLGPEPNPPGDWFRGKIS